MSSFQVEGLVPDEVMKKLKVFEASLEEVQRQLEIFLDMKNKDFETKTPLEKARIQLNLAHTINALFYMFLRTHGVAPEDHPVTRELQRLEHFQKKIEELEADSNQLPSHERETEERINDHPSTDVPSTGKDHEQERLQEVGKSNSASKKRSKSSSKHHASQAKEQLQQDNQLYSSAQKRADKKKKHKKRKSQEAD